jgi:uncharacterized membrane protein YraQ (UPF0718 family)
MHDRSLHLEWTQRDPDMTLIHHLGDAAMMTAGMIWQTAWSLILGFTLSALLQSTVKSDDLRRALGEGSAKEIALAAAAGAASSSCSYASAALMRTLFKKGAALVCALAFMVASTNLVLELGLILLVLLGWKFMLGQWIGGVVMIAIMSVVLKFAVPKHLIEEARNRPEAGSGHDHGSMMAEGKTWWARVKNPRTRVVMAQSFVMEWSMLWKDLIIGFVIGGLISAFVPNEVWKAIFLNGQSGWIAVPVDALIGPVLAVVTFVCSVGNIPLAAILWAGGASFAGVLSFIYADLIVLPLLDTYRRYFGWKFAAYLFAVLFVTMVLAGIIVDVGFAILHLTPPPNPNVRSEITHFSFNYTFWLNILLGSWAVYLFRIARTNRMDKAMHCSAHGK